MILYIYLIIKLLINYTLVLIKATEGIQSRVIFSVFSCLMNINEVYWEIRFQTHASGVSADSCLESEGSVSMITFKEEEE